MSRKKKEAEPEPIYEVAVWDHEGNVLKVLWHATADEADEVRELYADDPLVTVVVEER